MASISILFYIAIIAAFGSVWLSSILNTKSFDLWFYALILFLMSGITLVVKHFLNYPYDIYHYPLQDLIMAIIAAVIWHEKKHLWAVPMIFLFSLQAGISTFFISLFSDEFLGTFKIVYNVLSGGQLATIITASLIYIFKSKTIENSLLQGV